MKQKHRTSIHTTFLFHAKAAINPRTTLSIH